MKQSEIDTKRCANKLYFYNLQTIYKLSRLSNLFPAIHYYAHTYNIERFIEGHNSPNNVTHGLLSALSTLPVTANGTWLNPLRNPQTVSYRYLKTQKQLFYVTFYKINKLCNFFVTHNIYYTLAPLYILNLSNVGCHLVTSFYIYRILCWR